MSDPQGQIQLSVVVPTYNESDNVGEVVKRLDTSLSDITWEVIFVDDASPDGTADVIREVAKTDRRVRLISRHNRRGLSSAVVEGGLAASADIIAVMDGDLQHDESVLPALYRTIANDEADVASASRFLLEDGADGLSSETRLKISNTGIKVANKAFDLDMTDPLTGFFAMKREVLENAVPELSELGFKILLDLVTAAEPRPRIKELPFKFRERLHGESKLDNKVMYDFFLFFLEKKISPIIPLPARFLSFGIINSFGIIVHMAVLFLVLNAITGNFTIGQLAATLVAMLFNFSVNNAVTYHDMRLKGPEFYQGFVLFALLCSIGVFGNVSVANMIHDRYADLSLYAPALVGALMAVVWNYVATRAFVWGRAKSVGKSKRKKAASLAAKSRNAVHREATPAG